MKTIQILRKLKGHLTFCQRLKLFCAIQSVMFLKQILYQSIIENKASNVVFKPWGFEVLLFLVTDPVLKERGYASKLLVVFDELSYQVHQPFVDSEGQKRVAKTETQICLYGSSCMPVMDNILPLNPGVIVHIPAEARHQILKPSISPLIVLETSTPEIGVGSTTRLKDKYEGKRCEKDSF